MNWRTIRQGQRPAQAQPYSSTSVPLGTGLASPSSLSSAPSRCSVFSYGRPLLTKTTNRCFPFLFLFSPWPKILHVKIHKVVRCTGVKQSQAEEVEKRALKMSQDLTSNL